MHPDQSGTHQHEQQHEAARPQTGEIVQRAKRDRQHKAAQPADHADQTADRADVFGIVDGYVLVDRSLTQGHEESEHKHDYGERHHGHFKMERARPVYRTHDVVGRRIRQHEGASDGDQEGPIHDTARAIAI